MKKLSEIRVNDRKFRIILFIIFAIVVAIIGITQNYRLTNNARYTIGITGDVYWTTESGKQIDYTFTVNGEEYKKSDSYFDNEKGNGDRFYVEYDSKHPHLSELLHAKPVPDSIKSAPPNGWSKIPGE